MSILTGEYLFSLDGVPFPLSPSEVTMEQGVGTRVQMLANGSEITWKQQPPLARINVKIYLPISSWAIMTGLQLAVQAKLSLLLVIARGLNPAGGLLGTVMPSVTEKVELLPFTARESTKYPWLFELDLQFVKSRNVSILDIFDI